jgi:three-Cys-motif partner protein
MPAISPSEHFASYTENNRIKHEVLTRYLKQYSTALSRHADGFHYIDGFAGRGSYDGQPGSPLRALDVLGKQRRPFSMSLIEAEADLAEDLRAALHATPRPATLLDTPLIEVGEFSAHIAQVLSKDIYRRFRRVATFAFLDPCRAAGYGTDEVRAILAKPFGECLVFWNYEGVNRWLGIVASQFSGGEGLARMFGSREALEETLRIWQSSRNPAEKERDLLAHFLRSLRSYAEAEFLVPFRFTSDAVNRTSHFLVHCSRHPLAFRLMKEVMGSLRTNPEPGQFSYLGRSDVGDQFSMFEPDAQTSAIEAILLELETGPKPVSQFTGQWTERPDDFLRSKDYRSILLGMEAKGRIRVLEGEDAAPAPASKRKKIHGNPTLADRLWVGLPRRQSAVQR